MIWFSLLCSLFSLWIIPLHSSITIEEQRWAFVKPQAGERKVNQMSGMWMV